MCLIEGYVYYCVEYTLNVFVELEDMVEFAVSEHLKLEDGWTGFHDF